nr:hypothetical protein [Tanacetum cinerariifolium]
MTLTFADTHNMVAYLSKSKASEGFNQIIDFLNGSYIEYALTVNPTIYVSCIKQLWRTVAVKSSNYVTRLQALVDKKKVVVTEAAIRDALHLDDAEGVDCLPNEEIFTELARMGYEKPSTKLTFYKAFFSSQWKFLIHTILQSMSAKRTSWNEFSSVMASVVICLSTSRKFNFSKYIFESLVRNVDSSLKFYMYPRFIHLIIQNQLGNLSTHSTKYISPALTQKSDDEEQGDAEEQGNADNAVEEPVTAVPEDDEALDAYAALARRVEHLKHDKVAQDLEIVKLKTRVKKLEKTNKVKTLKLRRLRKVGTSQRVDTSDDTLMEDVMENTDDAQVKGRHADIYHIDMDHAAKVLSMQEDKSEVQEAAEVITTAKLITEVIAAVSVTDVVPAAVPETISAAVVPTATAAPVKVYVPSTRRKRRVVIWDPEEESSAKTPTETKSKDKGKGVMVEEPKPIKKKQQVELDEAYARKLHEEINQDINWDVAMDHVKQKAKEDPFIQRYQMMKKRHQTEAQARRNMMKVAKKRKLKEEAKEVEDLKQHLEIVPGEDDDVYTEATPLARKVPVVDYQIILVNNKP